MAGPYFTLRNARYRGTRESEKHLTTNLERIKDFRIIYKRQDKFSENYNTLRDELFNSTIHAQIKVVTKDKSSTYQTISINDIRDRVHNMELAVDSISRTIGAPPTSIQ